MLDSPAELGSSFQGGTAKANRSLRASRGARWAILGFFVGLALCAAYLIGQTAVFARAYSGRILPGAEIAGINVSGMTRQDASTAVEAVVAGRLDRTIRLVHLDRTFQTTPRALGGASDAEQLVGEALAARDAVGWPGLFSMRWMGGGLDFDQSVTVTHDEQAVRAFVERLSTEVNAPPRDASLDYSSGWIQFVREQPGWSVVTDATAADLVAALSDGRDLVSVQVLQSQPSVTLAAFDKVLLLRQREHRLYLYQNGVRTHSWIVATGTGGYPTPTGQYEVSLKRYMPTWVNPDPEGWGKDLPASIGPGSTNPLGVRALNWSRVGGIRFHGTSDIDSLGTSASHGCVRLSNADVVQLYDLVDVGTTIVSLG
ncbi:MAG: L,D-transpeptidase family protein [Egibacteraceae bacterium]